MPYTVRKQKCRQSSGKSGTYVLSYTDKKGKKHRNCHTSKKKAKGQIAAIEAEGADLLRSYLQEILNESLEEVALKIPEQPSQKEAFKELLSWVSKMLPGSESDVAKAKVEADRGNWDSALDIMKTYFMMKGIK